MPLTPPSLFRLSKSQVQIMLGYLGGGGVQELIVVKSTGIFGVQIQYFDDPFLSEKGKHHHFRNKTGSEEFWLTKVVYFY